MQSFFCFTPSKEGDDAIGGWLSQGGGFRLVHLTVCCILLQTLSYKVHPPVHFVLGPPLKRGFGLEGEEFVAVVFVLFSAQGDPGGQAPLQVVHQGVKAVKNGYNFFLN